MLPSPFTETISDRRDTVIAMMKRSAKYVLAVGIRGTLRSNFACIRPQLVNPFTVFDPK